jgi:hypothetical protein
MLNISNITSIEKADIGLSEEGHIVIRIKENADIDVSDIIEINEIKSRLANNQKHTVIFVAPFYGNITKEARELSASKLVYNNAIAKAIIAKSFSIKLISTFFININKPPAPTKIFETEEKAADWLTEMKSNYFSKNIINQ